MINYIVKVIKKPKVFWATKNCMLGAAGLALIYCLFLANSAKAGNTNNYFAVDEHNHLWHIDYAKLSKTQIQSAADAFNLTKTNATGISNVDLALIPIGIVNVGNDSDGDKVPDYLERALGTNELKIDSDSDGYDDFLEINNNYNPSGKNRSKIDLKFAKKLAGRIFIQVQRSGQAWYVNPIDYRRYALRNTTDYGKIISKISVSVKTSDLKNLHDVTSRPSTPALPTISAISTSTQPSEDGLKIIRQLAAAIHSGNSDAAASLCHPNIRERMRYTMNYPDAEMKQNLADLMMSATLSGQTEKYIYYKASANYNRGGYAVPIKFTIAKMDDGKWYFDNF